MGLTADAIEQVERLTKEAMRTEVLAVPGDPAGIVFLVGPDGKTEQRKTLPAWHAETLATPLELRRFIERQQKEVEASGNVEAPAVFYDEQRITYVYDIEDRRDRATCPLRYSPQYVWLQTCGGKSMSQADFVRALRITFRGCLPPDGNLLPLVRNLKFTADQSGAVALQHGRESIGRQISAAVTGEAAIPEEAWLHVPIFENHVFATRITCAVEVLPHEQQFRLTPYPMELRRALDLALEDLHELLSQEGLPPVYRGQP